MIGGPLRLPNGRRGQAFAVALTIIAAAMIWFAALEPLIGWYQHRADMLAQQSQKALRMAALGQEIPALRRAVRATGLQSASGQILLAGNTDAIAGANLESTLQDLAARAGTSLDSTALLPVQPAGALRRIGMQVSVTANLPVLVALLEAIGTALPRITVGDISVINAGQAATAQAQPMQAEFSVAGFRAGTP